MITLSSLPVFGLSATTSSVTVDYNLVTVSTSSFHCSPHFKTTYLGWSLSELPVFSKPAFTQLLMAQNDDLCLRLNRIFYRPLYKKFTKQLYLLNNPNTVSSFRQLWGKFVLIILYIYILEENCREN